MYKLDKQERAYRARMRGRYSTAMKWYAVMTHCGREYPVRDRIEFDLSDQGEVGILLPEVRTNERAPGGKTDHQPLLFSSYVFVRCRMNDAIYTSITAYRDVYQILGRAYRIPSVIHDAEMAHLRGVLATSPAPMLVSRLRVGEPVEITDGLLRGMRGQLVEFNARYAKIEVRFSFLDDTTGILVSVPRHQVRLEDRDRVWTCASPPSGAVRAV